MNKLMITAAVATLTFAPAAFAENMTGHFTEGFSLKSKVNTEAHGSVSGGVGVSEGFSGQFSHIGGSTSFGMDYSDQPGDYSFKGNLDVGMQAVTGGESWSRTTGSGVDAFTSRNGSATGESDLWGGVAGNWDQGGLNTDGFVDVKGQSSVSAFDRADIVGRGESDSMSGSFSSLGVEVAGSRESIRDLSGSVRTESVSEGFTNVNKSTYNSNVSGDFKSNGEVRAEYSQREWGAW